MPASERAAQSARPHRPSPSAVPAEAVPAGAAPPAETARSAPAAPSFPAALSMRDLLASCAAASAVSTPPRAVPREGRRHGGGTPRQDAA